MTLKPGDIILTSTPLGIGWSAEPRRILGAGDTVRCEIAEPGPFEARFRPGGA